MAAQASTLYATNIRHMMADLTPGKDGKIVHNMNDDVIRGATVTFEGAITYRRRRRRSRLSQPKSRKSGPRS